MTNQAPGSLESKFSKEAIDRQLERIFLDPLFKNSEILKKFLLFIVDQTLLGHSNSLKEYTIGVQVLSKPTDFRPQENGIVRIHAGRLRRALHHYYDNKGANDPLYISIPKGSYVPVFNEKHMPVKQGSATRDRQDKPIAIAVIPFRHVYNDALEKLIAEGVCWQVTSRLMRLRNFFVIAYYTIRDLFEKNTDIITLASTVGAEYILTGDIQSMDNNRRIYVQLVHMQTNQQVWSKMYERAFTTDNIFDLQDEIVQLIIADIKALKTLKTPKLAVKSIKAVA